MQAIDTNVTFHSLNNHLLQFKGRVSATYNSFTHQLFILCPTVGERWVIRTTPQTAIKIAKTYQTPLNIQ